MTFIMLHDVLFQINSVLLNFLFIKVLVHYKKSLLIIYSPLFHPRCHSFFSRNEIWRRFL